MIDIKNDNTQALLQMRKVRHKKNVKEAFEAAKHGEVINLSALMCGAEQTGADAFGGTELADNSELLMSDNWKVKEEVSK